MVQEKLSLPSKLLAAGFIVFEAQFFKNYQFNINAGWLGCSTYHPDHRFIRDGKLVDISLGGPTSAIYATPWSKELEGLYKARAVKCVAFKDGAKVVYKTHTGILPDDDFIDEFIK